MRGSYEHQWQEAMEGAVIQPSEGLWDTIVTSLDNERGRHNWVTILLVAATVTAAFAFPLTIGNSELESQNSIEQYVSQTDKTSTTDIINLQTDHDGEKLINKTIEESSNSKIVESQEDKSSAAPVTMLSDNEMSQDIRVDNSSKQSSLSSASIAVNSSSITKYGLSSFDLGNALVPANIDNYYFIPYYLPSAKVENRSLLASLNMGTGSLSANSEFGGFSMSAADFAEMPNGLNSDFSDVRTENPGNTYYFSAGIEVPIGRRWSLLGGLGYLAQKASGTSNILFDAGNGPQPLGAYDPILPGTIFLSESYDYSVTNSYVNMPITFKYPFVNRKIKFRGGVGISTDFMISHIVNSESFGKANYKPTSMDYRTVVLAGVINLDISYSLNNQYAVALETGWRKGFTAIDVNKDYYPSSFTIGLILFYKIK